MEDRKSALLLVVFVVLALAAFGLAGSDDYHDRITNGSPTTIEEAQS